MIWADHVKQCVDDMYRSIANTESTIDFQITNEIIKRTIPILDSISLARIASALYKIVKLEDNYVEP